MVNIDSVETCKILLKELFEIQGSMRAPMLVFERSKVTEVKCVSLPQEEYEDTDRLHQKMLYTIVDLIQTSGISRLFLGYEAFYIMEGEEKAVKVLIGTFYSDDMEQVWLAQIHEKKVGEWQDISGHSNRLGYEGLWKRAKAYTRN